MSSQSYFTKFVVTSAAWVEVKFPVYCNAWTMWTSGGSVLARGRNHGTLVALDAGAIVDNEDGTISIGAAGHGLTDGDTIFVPNGEIGIVPGGNYTLEAATDADNLCITATYGDGETLVAGKVVHGYIDAPYPDQANDSDYCEPPLAPKTVLFKLKAVSDPVTVNFRYI